MKNLRISMKMLSLLLTICATVFFTACKNDVVTKEIPAKLEINKTLDHQTFLLPNGFDNEDDEITYLQNISDKEAAKLIDNYKVMMFLLQENKIAEVTRNLADFEHIADVGLSKHLSVDQLTRLQSFNPETAVESRGLNCWTQTGYCYTRRKCCFTDGWDVYCWIAWTHYIC